MLIIGITGTIGSGKGTVVDYLVQEKGFQHCSVRGFLIQEIVRRNMLVDRDSMRVVANDLREKFGPSYIVEQLFEQAATSNQNCVIESIRAIGEVEALKSKGDFYLLAVDADQDKRYERAILRNSESDHVSFEKFVEQEETEMQSDDPNKQNLAGCILLADYKIYNNGTVQELQLQIEDILNSIKNNE